MANVITIKEISAMTSKEFWQLIDLIEITSVHEGMANGSLNDVKDALTVMPEKQIEAFEQHLHEMLYAIDGEDFFDASGETSGDGFLYCRCFVVAQGYEYYQKILNNPDQMECIDFEPLLYVAGDAWSTKTGKDPLKWNFIATVSYETCCNASRWKPIEKKELKLTPAQQEIQRDLEYKRTLSSVRHWYKKGLYQAVVNGLEPFSDRLSNKFRKLLQDARDQIKISE